MKAALFIISVTLILCIASCKTAPNACFQVVTAADSIRAGHTVSFDASCTTDAGNYYWDFGNGQTISATTTPQITYDSAGTYRIALTVGSNGKSASTTKMITVNR